MNFNLSIPTDITAAAGGLPDCTSERRKQDSRRWRASRTVLHDEGPSEYAVLLDLSATARHLNTARSNLANRLSFLQTQDAGLSAAGKVLARIAELKVREQPVYPDASAREMEFAASQRELVAILTMSLHGEALFSPDAMPVSMCDDASIASMIEFDGIDLLGASDGSEGSGQMAMILSASRLSALPAKSIETILQAVAVFRVRNSENRRRVAVLMELLAQNEEAPDSLADEKDAEDNTHSASMSVLSQTGSPTLFQSRRTQQAVLNLIV